MQQQSLHKKKRLIQRAYMQKSSQSQPEFPVCFSDESLKGGKTTVLRWGEGIIGVKAGVGSKRGQREVEIGYFRGDQAEEGWTLLYMQWQTVPTSNEVLT